MNAGAQRELSFLPKVSARLKTSQGYISLLGNNMKKVLWQLAVLPGE